MISLPFSCVVFLAMLKRLISIKKAGIWQHETEYGLLHVYVDLWVGVRAVPMDAPRFAAVCKTKWAIIWLYSSPSANRPCNCGGIGQEKRMDGTSGPLQQLLHSRQRQRGWMWWCCLPLVGGDQAGSTFVYINRFYLKLFCSNYSETLDASLPDQVPKIDALCYTGEVFSYHQLA